jgi:hypothetical protein
MTKRKRQAVRAWQIWLADRHHAMINRIVEHYTLESKVAAVRLALKNELSRGPITETLEPVGALARRWCMERDRWDRDRIAKIMVKRHLRHEADAVRIAIEREFAAIGASKSDASEQEQKP